LFYDQRYMATPLSGPDYVQLAKAYGIPALRVDRATEVMPAIMKAIETQGAFLIEFLIDAGEKVYPMVPPGASLVEFREGAESDAVDSVS
jgi:acetolactate synthase-1/2/3 large subunit